MKKTATLIIGFLFAIIISLQLYTLHRLDRLQNDVDGITGDTGDLIDHMKRQQGIEVLGTTSATTDDGLARYKKYMAGQ